MQIKLITKYNHPAKWFGVHWTGLMIMWRRYHVIDRTAVGQKKTEKASGKGLLSANPRSSLRSMPASLC